MRLPPIDAMLRSWADARQFQGLRYHRELLAHDGMGGYL